MITEVKYKGITTSPSDYESTDGELAIGSNIISDNGALVVPDPSPTPKIEFGSNKPLFIHTPLGGTMANYIVQNGQKIRYWTYKEGNTPSLTDSDNIYTMSEGEGLYQCTAVGNTLIVLTSAGINYFLFKDGAYKNLGKELPDLKLQCKLYSNTLDVVNGTGVIKYDDMTSESDNEFYSKVLLSSRFSTMEDSLQRLDSSVYAWMNPLSRIRENMFYTKSETPSAGDDVFLEDGSIVGTIDKVPFMLAYSSFTIHHYVHSTITFEIPILNFEGIVEDFTISTDSSWRSSEYSCQIDVVKEALVFTLHGAYSSNNSTVITISNSSTGQSASVTMYDRACGFTEPWYITKVENTPTIVMQSESITTTLIRLATSDKIKYAGYNKSNRVYKIQLNDGTNGTFLRHRYSYWANGHFTGYEGLVCGIYFSKQGKMSEAALSFDKDDTAVWQKVSDNTGNHAVNIQGGSGLSIGDNITDRYNFILLELMSGNKAESNNVILEFMVSDSAATSAYTSWQIKSDEEVTNKIIGLVNDFIKTHGMSQNKFIYPFFLRYAYRMYDGSIVRPSAPILMLPCSGPTPLIFFDSSDKQSDSSYRHYVSALCCDVKFNILSGQGISDYSDIITGVVLAVSNPIYTIDVDFKEGDTGIASKVIHHLSNTSTLGYHYADYKVSSASVNMSNDRILQSQHFTDYVNPYRSGDHGYFIKPPTFSDEERVTNIENALAAFYIVQEYSNAEFRALDSTTGFLNTLNITGSKLSVLPTLEVFKENNLSLRRFIPQTAFMYNNRLNIGNYDQVMFNGYDAALLSGYYTLPSQGEVQHLSYKMGSAVEGSHEGNYYKVVNKYNSNIKNGGLTWFFYPENSAKTAIVNGQSIALKQHPTLNGSYWINDFKELAGITNESNPTGGYQATINVTADMRNKYLSLAFGQSIGDFRVVFTYKKIAKLDPSVDVNSINAPMESFVHTFTRQTATGVATFWINSTVTDTEATPTTITQTLVRMTIYANVTQASYKETAQPSSSTTITFTTGAILSYPNKIASSVLNNPFNFEASGVSQIQSERIIALSSATKALGQEQHGTHPLYVFTNDGVFGMQVDSEGRYITKNPVCRDVVLGGGESITQIDDAVVFASARGIMSLAGEQAVCISEKLNELLIPPVAISIPPIITEGRIRSGSGQPIEPMIGCRKEPFKEYVNGAIIVFDYLNQRLVVSNRNYDYSYVYSIRTKQWSYYDGTFVSSLNSYPDGLAVDGANNVIDVADSTVNQYVYGTDKYGGWFLTRPISLGDSESYKVIDFVRQNGMYKQFSLYAWKNDSVVRYTPVETPLVGDYVYDADGNRVFSGTAKIQIVEVNTEAATPYIKVSNHRSVTYQRDTASDITASDRFSFVSSVSAPSGADNDSGNYSTQEYAHQYGGYVSNAIQQVLYGSNDLINWHIISSSRSPRISDYSGSPYKWFRLAVRCTFLAGGSLSSVTFSWRKKFDNDRLL